MDAVLRGAATAAARVQVASQLGLSEQALDSVIRPVVIVAEDLGSEAPVDDLAVARGVAAFFSIVILFILVMAFGQFVGSAVVEEKQTRVADSSWRRCRPRRCSSARCSGSAAWACAADPARPDLRLRAVGVRRRVRRPGPVRLGFSSLAWMALWFVIGYAMYSFVFATMGATVSRLEDLQSLTYVPSVLLLPAYAIAAASLTGAPSPLLAPMSMIPIWSPLLMPFRIVTGNAPGGRWLSP